MMTRVSDQQCSIGGSVFSMEPDASSRSTGWIVKSPSIQGWARHAGEVDLSAEWSRFTQDILSLESRGCFPAGESFFTIPRAIIEKIPLPANETLLFFYSMGNRGFADLVPGMQIKVETPLLEAKGSVNGKAGENRLSAYHGSAAAQYEVVALSQGGVALHLFATENRQSRKMLGSEAGLIFGLSARFGSRPMLRLFLQSLKDNNTLRSPMLIGASDAA